MTPFYYNIDQSFQHPLKLCQLDYTKKKFIWFLKQSGKLIASWTCSTELINKSMVEMILKQKAV